MTEAQIVYAVCEHHNCEGEQMFDLRGTPVVALYVSKQTAEQHAQRDNLYVQPMTVLTKLREY